MRTLTKDSIDAKLGYMLSILSNSFVHSFDLLSLSFAMYSIYFSHCFSIVSICFDFHLSFYVAKAGKPFIKWVDEVLLDEIRRVEAEQGRIVEEIEDLKSSITQRIEEEVRKQKNSLELGCLGSILWLFGRLRSQE